MAYSFPLSSFVLAVFAAFLLSVTPPHPGYPSSIPLQNSGIWCVAVDFFGIEYLLGFGPLEYHAAVRLL